MGGPTTWNMLKPLPDVRQVEHGSVREVSTNEGRRLRHLCSSNGKGPNAQAYMAAQVDAYGKMQEAFMKKKLWCPVALAFGYVFLCFVVIFACFF